MRERTVEQHLKARVEETGGLIRKVQWIGRNGAPDRLVGWPTGGFAYNAEGYPEEDMPCHFLIELKRPAKRAEAHQAREHERLRAIGFDVRVLDTIEKVDQFVMEVTGR